MKTFHRATAVVAAALLSASLTACSLIRIQNSSSDQETSSAQETDSTDTQSTAPTAGSGKDATDGYQTVTTPSSMISFAVPENWQVFSGDDQNIPLPTGTQDPDGQGSQSLPAIELAAAAPKTNDGVPEHLFAIPVEQIAFLPTEEMMSSLIKARGGTPGEYSTSETELGEAAVMTFTSTIQGTTMQSAAIVTPDSGGGWTSLTLSTSDASRTRELTDVIMSTLSS